MAAQHAVQVRALGAAVVVRLRAVAQRALGAEERLARIGIRGERRSGARSQGEHGKCTSKDHVESLN